MLSILQKEYEVLHQKGGKPPKLMVEDKLYITLKYLREYRTMDSIAAEYGDRGLLGQDSEADNRVQHLYTSEIQKISFAAGYAIGDPRTIPIDYEADKRLMKLG
jgi:hypothetical protein